MMLKQTKNQKKTNNFQKKVYRKKPQPKKVDPTSLKLTNSFSTADSTINDVKVLCSKLVISGKKVNIKKSTNYRTILRQYLNADKINSYDTSKDFFEPVSGFVFNSDKYLKSPDPKAVAYDITVLDPNEIKNHMQEFIDTIYKAIDTSDYQNIGILINKSIREIYNQFSYGPLSDTLSKPQNVGCEQSYTVPDAQAKFNNTYIREYANIIATVQKAKNKRDKIEPNHIKTPIRAILFELCFSIQSMIDLGKQNAK